MGPVMGRWLLEVLGRPGVKDQRSFEREMGLSGDLWMVVGTTGWGDNRRKPKPTQELTGHE